MTTAKRLIFCVLSAHMAVCPAAFALPPEDPSSRPPLLTVPQPVSSPREPMYVGEHTAVRLETGVGFVDRAGGPSLGDVRAAYRLSVLLQLVDVEAFIDLGAYGHTASEPARRRFGVGAQLNFHPAFIALVWKNTWGILASGVHGFAGLEWLSGPGAQVCPSVGLGIDLPLMSLDRSAGLWVTPRVAWRWLAAAYEDGPDYDDTRFSLGISWRWYDAFR